MEAKETEFLFNDEQKNAINIEKNAVVSAGAGSGKTRVLAERYADLILKKHYKVDEILTLTFTKKATNEMSSRIYKRIKEKAPDAAKEFYKAHIQTLDSYCSSIAKLGAHYYGINPDFSVDPDGVNSMIHDMALPFILEHHTSKCFQKIVGEKDFQKKTTQLFANTILKFSSLSKPVNFIENLEKQKIFTQKEWKRLCILCESKKGSFQEVYEMSSGNKDTKTIVAIKAVFDTIDEDPDAVFLTVENFCTNESSAREYIRHLKKYTSLKLSTAKGFDEIKEILKSIRNIKNSLESIFNFFKGYDVIKEASTLLTVFQENVNIKKRTSGILSYKDVSDLALKTLIDFPEIRLLEKKRYKEILIDEFQDNNADQKNLLFLLAEKIERMEKSVPSKIEDLEENKLFFVGDEKQSIYRFRGADVSVFRELKDFFKDGYLEMNTNYRSDPELIAAFNTIFGAQDFILDQKEVNIQNPAVFMLNEKNSDIPLYEATYSKVLIPQNKYEVAKAKTQFIPHMHIALASSAESEDEETEINDSDEREAVWVARKIKELKKENKIEKYSQVAILMRSYSLQPVYERVLLREGVPYSAEVIKGFFSDGPVNDLINFIRLCVYENDSLAYICVLRSPFVCLNTKEVESIMTDISLKGEYKIFSDSSKLLLSQESKKRFENAKKLYENIKSLISYEPLTKILSTLWYEYGYRYETIWNKKVEMHNRLYDMLFELARLADENCQGAAAFVDSLRTYFDQESKLEGMDIPLEKQDCINIMSIFKSKGLEWPVVFVCGITKNSARDKNDSPSFYSKQFGVCLNTPPDKEFNGNENYIYSQGKEENKLQTAAELRRITYVAFTRARNELYITGVYKNKKGLADMFAGNKKKYGPDDNPPGTIFNTIQSMFISYTEPDGDKSIKLKDNIKAPFDFTLIPSDFSASDENIETRKNSFPSKLEFLKKVKPLYDNAEIIETEEIPELYISPSQLDKEDEEIFSKGNSKIQTNNEVPYSKINEIVDSTGGKFDYTNFGTIAHAYLEAALNGQEPSYSSKEFLGLADKKNAVDEVKKICNQMSKEFIESDLGKNAINSEWKKTEYNFRCSAGKKIIKGTIDFVFKNSDSSYTIVDYKTNSVIDPQIYITQLAFYKYAFEAMTGLSADKIKCKLFYLRYAKEIDITEECKNINIEKEITKYFTSEAI